MTDGTKDVQGGQFISRRNLLKTGVAVGAITLTAGGLTGCLPKTRVRQDLLAFSKDKSKVEALRAAVKIMRQRAPEDPTSWQWQANIHGAAGYTAKSALEKDCWNSCPHGGFLFFPWHRGYLYWLEQIMIAAIKDDSFALPYWNYTVDKPENRKMPEIYRMPANIENSLWDNNRLPYVFGDNDNLVINVGAGDPIPWDALDPELAFGINTFCTYVRAKDSTTRSFGSSVTEPGDMQSVHFVPNGFGALESTPHNNVHNFCGGLIQAIGPDGKPLKDKDGNDVYAQGDMTDIDTAARDPIFYAHHSNIDRLWASWVKANPENHLNPTGEEQWMNQQMFFADPDGNRVTEMPMNLLETDGRLNYIYDSYYQPTTVSTGKVSDVCVDKPLGLIATTKSLGATGKPAISLGAGGGRTTTKLQPKQPKQMMLNSIAPTQGKQAPVLMTLEGITTSMQPMMVAVFINLPEGQEASLDSPYFAGVLSVFGIQGTEMSTTWDQTFDISDELAALRAAGQYDGGEITVTLIGKNQNALTIENVNISQ